MVRSHRCAKSYVCAVLVTVIVFFNILTVHQLSKSRPSHFIHTYGSLYVGRLNKFKTCRPIGLSSKPLPLISLASYPGSGNTWLRHLLQQATGIATGSEYVDLGLKYYGFPGEGISNRSVLTVKTHESTDETLQKFDKGILLIRKPEDALLAEFNRRCAGHLGHAQKIHFKIEWKSFLYEEMERWYTFNSRWLQYSGPLKIIRYDTLQQNTEIVLKSVLEYLKIIVTNEDLSCVVRNVEGTFKRPGNTHNYFGQTIFTVSEKEKLVRYWNNILTGCNNRKQLHSLK